MKKLLFVMAYCFALGFSLVSCGSDSGGGGGGSGSNGGTFNGMLVVRMTWMYGGNEIGNNALSEQGYGTNEIYLDASLEPYKLYAYIEMAGNDTAYHAATWLSSDTSVIYFQNPSANPAVITFDGAGSATVTVTCAGKQSKYDFNVHIS